MCHHLRNRSKCLFRDQQRCSNIRASWIIKVAAGESDRCHMVSSFTILKARKHRWLFSSAEMATKTAYVCLHVGARLTNVSATRLYWPICAPCPFTEREISSSRAPYCCAVPLTNSCWTPVSNPTEYSAIKSLMAQTYICACGGIPLSGILSSVRSLLVITKSRKLCLWLEKICTVEVYLCGLIVY